MVDPPGPIVRLAAAVVKPLCQLERVDHAAIERETLELLAVIHELKSSYYEQAVKNLSLAAEPPQRSLFNMKMKAAI